MSESKNIDESQPAISKRLLSLDVYRGVVMLLLATQGLGIARATANSEGAFAKWLHFQFSHPLWISQFNIVGVAIWDMIQPAFMFIVGVSMPFSYGKRAKLGESFLKRMRHAWVRALMLTLLGIFLASMSQIQTKWLFTNVLAQIGLGYGFLFFLVGKSWRTQFTVGIGILLSYWGLMLIFPLGNASIAEHFENGKTFPQQVDLWFINLFPQSKPFTGLSYATLNFVPAMVTMLMGLMCGQVLKDQSLSEGTKLRKLLIAAAACFAAGIIWSFLGCPVIKKLWTPSWTLYSGGYVIAALALSYWIIDVKKWKGWVFPFVVVGLNPLMMYLLGQICRSFTIKSLKTHLPDIWFAGNYGQIVQATLVALIFWLILWGMYKNRVFLRM